MDKESVKERQKKRNQPSWRHDNPIKDLINLMSTADLEEESIPMPEKY